MKTLKTFLINLDQRPDRLSSVKEQLAALHIDFERVAATNGELISAEEKHFFDEEKFFLNCKRKAVAGEIGCALSHRRVWQQIVDCSIPYALILEDDITLCPQIRDFLSDARHYEGFDFLNISSNAPYYLDEQSLQHLKQQSITSRPRSRHARAAWKKIEWRRKWRIFHLFFHGDAFTVCECDPAPALGSGYIVSLRGAQHLLKTSDKLSVPIDLTWRMSGGRLRQGFLARPLIRQTRDDSNIVGREQTIQMTPWQKVKRFFVKTRRWKRRLDALSMYGWSKRKG